MLRETQARHPGSGLTPEQWDAFLLMYQGNVDDALANYIARVDEEIAKINGVAPPVGDPSAPLIADDADLDAIQLATLRAEMARLEKLISEIGRASCRERVCQYV